MVPLQPLLIANHKTFKAVLTTTEDSCIDFWKWRAEWIHLLYLNWARFFTLWKYAYFTKNNWSHFINGCSIYYIAFYFFWSIFYCGINMNLLLLKVKINLKVPKYFICYLHKYFIIKCNTFLQKTRSTKWFRNT